MLTKKKKEKIIEKFRTHKHDTGSAEVQIAILTAEVKELTKHLKDHNKDFSSRRGLLRKVSQRRKLLRYLRKDNEKSFNKLIKVLKLKAPRVDDDTSGIPDSVIEAMAAEKLEKAEKAEKAKEKA